MRRPNHASRFEGIAKTKLQASRASDTETLQSQVNKAAKKRLSLSGLEILHGRLTSYLGGPGDDFSRQLLGHQRLDRARILGGPIVFGIRCPDGDQWWPNSMAPDRAQGPTPWLTMQSAAN